MKLDLPPVKPFRMASQQANGWSDNYGAIHLAAAYAGMKLDRPYFIRGVWHHGCCGPWESYNTELLAFSAPRAKGLPVLAARQDQADLLKAGGYSQARAIGLPILYSPPSGLTRIPRSLLVMPCHTLVGFTFAERAPFRAYVEEIRAIARGFDRVVVCIHPNCRKNGLWVDEFTAAGFELVDGALVNDLNSLARMRALFEQFETVTTNGWGSHVAYALALGARVSIFGTYPAPGEDNLLKDVSWANDKAALKQALSAETAAKEAAFLQPFKVPPARAVADRALGDWLIGAAHKLTPAAMREVLGEILDLCVAEPVRTPTKSGQANRILFVCHEATRTGAPMFLLHFLRWLREHTDQGFDILMAKGGPLQPEFAQVGVVIEPSAFLSNPRLLQNYRLIYANTACNGNLLEEIGCGDIPVITHFHELDQGFNWLGARQLAGVVRQTSRYVACAGAVADRLQTVFKVPADRISRHYEMVDPAVVTANVAAADAAKLRQEFGLPADAFIVTACGTLDLRKAPDLFVQMAARLKSRLGADRPLRFLWIGAQNSPDLQIMVRQDVRKLGLDAEFQLVAELPSPHGLLALSDLFCLTSREDPFPLVMLEAALLEKPVLCFAGAGGAEEFCAAGGGLSVPYLDVVAMADLAHDLLRDPDRRATLGRQAAAAVRQHFTSETVAPALWQEIRQHLVSGLPLPAERNPQISHADIYRGWHPTQAPQPAYIAAHLTRAAVRAQAADLHARGRNREAVQILVKAVTADLASKQAWIICEGLVEIAHDLTSYDPRQAAALLEKAREVSRVAGIRLETLQPRAAIPAAA